MKKRKIPIICVSFILLIVCVLLIIFFIIKKDNRMNFNKWETILTDFEECESVSINYNDGTLEFDILKQNNNYEFKDLKNNTVEYFEKNKFRYYYTDNWKKIEEEIIYPINLNYSLILYIDLFDNFSYDKKNNCYYMNNATVNDISYNKVEIYISGDMVIRYKLINDKIISYDFSNHNATKVSLPTSYDKVFKELDEESWIKIVNDTSSYNVYNYTSLSVKSLNGEDVEANSKIGQCKENEVYETINQVNYKYILNNDNWDYYKENNGIYEYVSSISKEVVSFSQMTKLPYDVLMVIYNNFEYNEIANSYVISNLEVLDCYYEELVINILNGKISYISQKYSKVEDGVKYDYLKIIDFTFID